MANSTCLRKKMIEKWPAKRIEDIQDFWKRLKNEMRQLCKGMSANLDGQIKRDKTRLLQDIKELDGKVYSQSMGEEEWTRMYNLERELEGIYTYEERIWSKRCSENGYYKEMLILVFSQHCKWQKEEMYNLLHG
jgi:hypothetical protein